MTKNSIKRIYPIKLLTKSFEDWREEQNNEAKRVCNIASVPPFFPSSQSKNIAEDSLRILSTFPNTIVRITRQMCECDEDCTQYSLRRFQLKLCVVYRMQGVLTNDDYYDNIFINKKVVNGTLIDKDADVDRPVLNNEIRKYVNDICIGKMGSLRKLKCRVYEMKDLCKEEVDCFTEVTDNILPLNFRTCANKNFSDHLSNIGQKIGNPLVLKNVRVSRSVSANSEINPISSTESIGSFSGNISLPLLSGGVFLSLICLKYKDFSLFKALLIFLTVGFIVIGWK